MVAPNINFKFGVHNIINYKLRHPSSVSFTRTILAYIINRGINGREFALIGEGVFFLGSYARGSFISRKKNTARKTSCPTERNLPVSARKIREFFFLESYSGSLRDLLREFYSWQFFPLGSFARTNNKPLAHLRESIRNISCACANQSFACSLICANSKRTFARINIYLPELLRA